MPHKRNPETCERVCGLARIVRSLTIPALEDITTWHERDLTQSSAERFILPESNILLDYMLNLMCDVIADLRVDSQRMLHILLQLFIKAHAGESADTGVLECLFRCAIVNNPQLRKERPRVLYSDIYNSSRLRSRSNPLDQ